MEEKINKFNFLCNGAVEVIANQENIDIQMMKKALALLIIDNIFNELVDEKALAIKENN